MGATLETSYLQDVIFDDFGSILLILAMAFPSDSGRRLRTSAIGAVPADLYWAGWWIVTRPGYFNPTRLESLPGYPDRAEDQPADF